MERKNKVTIADSNNVLKPQTNNTNLECTVTDIISEIGIPAHIKGYQYLREAVLSVLEDTDIINAVTKERVRRKVYE